MIVESALLAVSASVLAVGFCSWAAPLVTSMFYVRIARDPVRLIFPAGRRELMFDAALALLVTVLFGLAPALRASAVPPVSA